MQVKVLKLTGSSVVNHHLPGPFLPFLYGSTIRPEKYFYWWRAVSAPYIVRPNERTLQAIKERKAIIFPQGSIPRGSISVHVRHGDKGIESPLVEDSQYVKTVEELLESAPATLALTRSIFLTTEDADTIKHFDKLQGYSIMYTDVERYTSRELSPMAFAGMVGKANEMLNSLVSLDLALKCDAFVGTLTSNWSRLIDELRATARCKAACPYMDAQQNNTLADYNVDWRRSH